MSRFAGFALRNAAFVVGPLLAVNTMCAAPTSLLHQSAPEFARTDIQGQQVDIASLRGRVVLLSFWATWCAPCQIEMPQFVHWQSELGPRGLQIVAVSMDDDAAPVVALTRKRNVNYPVVMGDEQLGKLYGGVLGLPVAFLIDRRGTVVGVFQGGSKLSAMKEQILRSLAEP